MIIPSHPMYGIDHSATVYDLSTGEIVEEFRDTLKNRAVSIKRLIKNKIRYTKQRLDRLMLQTFKPYKDQSLDHAWLSVKYHDRNRDNLDINNLDWDETQYVPEGIPGGGNVPFGMWFSIPGYPNLEITLTPFPKIRRKDIQYELPFHKTNSGYWRINTTKDGAALVHRLVALTFLKHPLDPSLLVVNHEDGDRGNPLWVNLKWMTQSGNTLHSVDAGVRSKTLRKIEVKNTETGKIKTFPGLSAAARYVGSEAAYVLDILTLRKDRSKPAFGYLFRYSDEMVSFEDIESDPFHILADTKIAVKDIYTGLVSIYDGYKELCESLQMRYQTLWRIMMKDVMTPKYGKLFQIYNGKDLFWPDYPLDIIAVFDRSTTNDIPYKVTAPDGSVRYIAKIREWCEEDIARPLPGSARRSVEIYGTCQGYRFETIDLSQWAPKATQN